MEFKKKLKTRLYIAIIYISLGIMMITGIFAIKTDNDFISSFGFALVVMGIVRLRNYFMITKNEETIKKQQIAETDERNLSILNKAKSATFTIYITLMGTAVIILSLFNMRDIAKYIAYSVCLLVVIYWIAYWIYQKRS